MDEQEIRAWTASWAALGTRMVLAIAKANANSVLVLPVLGEAAISFPDESSFPLVWQAGSQAAQDAYFRSLHQTQYIPTVETFFRKLFSEAKVPVVERNPEMLKRMFDEHDVAAVFSSKSELARVGQIVEADAICSIKYDFAFDCTFEYESGIPVTPLNHYRYRMTATCVDVRTAETLFADFISSESIRLSGIHAYGLLDPYYLICLAALAPDLFLSLGQPTVTDPRTLCSRAIIAAHPMFADKLHDCDQANEYIKRAKAFPANSEPEWVLCATISHAMCRNDRVTHEVEYEKLLALAEGWSEWYRDSVRDMYGQLTAHEPSR